MKMNTLKKLGMTLTALLLIASTNNYSKEISIYKIIGETKKGETIYYSVFTSNDLTTSCKFFYEKLRLESTRANKIVLFYNDQKMAPSSLELEINKLFNESLIGGLEKYQGSYYILKAEGNKLVRGGSISGP